MDQKREIKITNDHWNSQSTLEKLYYNCQSNI